MAPKACTQKAFILGLLAACALSGVAVVCVGIFVKFPWGKGVGSGGLLGGGAPTAPPGHLLVNPPQLQEQMKSFDPDVCFDSYNLTWESGSDGQIYVNGEPFFMKGK